jgi:hypothetical protein
VSSIVDELIGWARAHVEYLRSHEIEVERFPERSREAPWKATLGLNHRGFLVNYTVWERTVFQSTLLVLNSQTKKTIVMDEKTAPSLEAVRQDLDEIVSKLLGREYENIK